MKTSFFFLCLCLVINVTTFGQGTMNIEQEFMVNENQKVEQVVGNYTNLELPLDVLLLDFITEINKERAFFGYSALTIDKKNSNMARKINKKMIRFEVVKNYKSGGREEIDNAVSKYSTVVSGAIFTVHKYSSHFRGEDFINQIRKYCYMDILVDSEYSEIIISLELDESTGFLYNTMIVHK
jgi:hypothetical protein